jgi:hypothetical protein
MSRRELYEEMGRQLGVTAEADLAESQRSLAARTLLDAIAAISDVLGSVTGMKDLRSLDAVGSSLIREGERLQGIAARYVEDGLLAEAKASEDRLIRNAGAGHCQLCGSVGEHICRVAAGLPEVKETVVTTGPAPSPEYFDGSLWK